MTVIRSLFNEQSEQGLQAPELQLRAAKTQLADRHNGQAHFRLPARNTIAALVNVQSCRGSFIHTMMHAVAVINTTTMAIVSVLTTAAT